MSYSKWLSLMHMRLSVLFTIENILSSYLSRHFQRLWYRVSILLWCYVHVFQETCVVIWKLWSHQDYSLFHEFHLSFVVDSITMSHFCCQQSSYRKDWNKAKIWPFIRPQLCLQCHYCENLFLVQSRFSYLNIYP